MKRSVLFLIASLVMSTSIPAFATEKDECLLASKNCKAEVDSLQQKMKKLNGELKKGKMVYSAEELKKLNEKLKEANVMLDTLMKPGK